MSRQIRQRAALAEAGIHGDDHSCRRFPQASWLRPEPLGTDRCVDGRPRAAGGRALQRRGARPQCPAVGGSPDRGLRPRGATQRNAGWQAVSRLARRIARALDDDCLAIGRDTPDPATHHLGQPAPAGAGCSRRFARPSCQRDALLREPRPRGVLLGEGHLPVAAIRPVAQVAGCGRPPAGASDQSCRADRGATGARIRRAVFRCRCRLRELDQERSCGRFDLGAGAPRVVVGRSQRRRRHALVRPRSRTGGWVRATARRRASIALHGDGCRARLSGGPVRRVRGHSTCSAARTMCRPRRD